VSGAAWPAAARAAHLPRALALERERERGAALL
jgi:hypothetical protein